MTSLLRRAAKRRPRLSINLSRPVDRRWGGMTKGAKQAQKWLSKSYKLWRQWSGYLVEFSLEPHNQRKSIVSKLFVMHLTDEC